MATNEINIRIDYGKKKIDQNKRNVEALDRKQQVQDLVVDNRIREVDSEMTTAIGYAAEESLANSQILAQELDRVDSKSTMRWRGVWRVNQDYLEGDVVRFEDQNWVAVRSSFGKSPATNPGFWDFAGVNYRNGGGGGGGVAPPVAAEGFAVKEIIPGETITIPARREMAIHGPFINDGVLIIEGCFINEL